MSAAQAESAAVTLLDAIVDPAVIVDKADLVMAWNAAAQSWLGLPEEVSGRPVEALAGARTHGAWRLALADPAGGALLVWHVDENGLGPDDVALEKLDIIGRIAGGVYHDLMNPLGALMGFADMQAADPGVAEDLREAARTLVGAAQRIQRMTRNVLGFARSHPPDPKPLAVGSLVRDLVALLGHATTNMQVRVAVPDGLPEVEADRSQLQQAILALVVNALEAQGTSWASGAGPAPGRLLVSGRTIEDAGGNRVRLAIEDGGLVVPLDERGALFSGGGVGRAGRDLAVARALVAQAGGRVSYEPVAAGNRIVVELPVAGTKAPEAEAGPPLVLVCDALPLIRTLLVRFTTRLGVKAIEARDGREAMAILARQPVALVIADLGVEDGGDDFYDQAVALRPELATRFVLLSADPGNAKLVEFTRRTGVQVIPKPFDNVRLDQLVRDAIDG
jgi:signal transduction histidine kinase/CheY-like chemotaxis protein